MLTVYFSSLSQFRLGHTQELLPGLLSLSIFRSVASNRVLRRIYDMSDIWYVSPHLASAEKSVAHIYVHIDRLHLRMVKPYLSKWELFSYIYKRPDLTLFTLKYFITSNIRSFLNLVNLSFCSRNVRTHASHVYKICPVFNYVFSRFDVKRYNN